MSPPGRAKRAPPQRPPWFASSTATDRSRSSSSSAAWSRNCPARGAQINLELAAGSVNSSRLERALRKAEFEPDSSRAWRWTAAGRASPRRQVAACTGRRSFSSWRSWRLLPEEGLPPIPTRGWIPSRTATTNSTGASGIRREDPQLMGNTHPLMGIGIASAWVSIRSSW